MSTWGYRVVAIADGEEVEYGLYEVQYGDDLVPVGMSAEPVLVSTRRDFSDVLWQLGEAIKRPVHDPADPQPAPRSMKGPRPPCASEADALPITLPEMINYHRLYAADLADAIHHGRLNAEMMHAAFQDREMSLRIAKTLAAIPNLDAVRQQLATYLEAARKISLAHPPSNPDDMSKDLDVLDGHLENALGLLGMIGNPPGPDGCEVCLGARGGTPGNENIVDGVVMCDYCHAEVSGARRSA